MINNANPSLNYAKNNKERMPWEHYLNEFKEMDPIKTSKRSGVPYNMETCEFTVDFMGTTYHIHYPDFHVTHIQDNSVYYPLEDNNYAKILVNRYLLNAAPISHNGDFVAYREVPWGEVYYQQFYGRCIGRLARKYGNNIKAFEKVMETLGAKKIKAGDSAYELELMKDLYVRFILWQGDDEFSPSSQILFSSNFPASFSAEDLAVVGDICLNTFGKVEKLINL